MITLYYEKESGMFYEIGNGIDTFTPESVQSIATKTFTNVDGQERWRIIFILKDGRTVEPEDNDGCKTEDMPDEIKYWQGVIADKLKEKENKV